MTYNLIQVFMTVIDIKTSRLGSNLLPKAVTTLSVILVKKTTIEFVVLLKAEQSGVYATAVSYNWIKYQWSHADFVPAETAHHGALRVCL